MIVHKLSMKTLGAVDNVLIGCKMRKADEIVAQPKGRNRNEVRAESIGAFSEKWCEHLPFLFF